MKSESEDGKLRQFLKIESKIVLVLYRLYILNMVVDALYLLRE